MTLQYNIDGTLDTSDPWLTVAVDRDGWITNAQTYCPVTELALDCTEKIRTSEKWVNQIVQDFCEREQANASDKYSAAEDHDYFREGRGA